MGRPKKIAQEEEKTEQLVKDPIKFSTTDRKEAQKLQLKGCPLIGNKIVGKNQDFSVSKSVNIREYTFDISEKEAEKILTK